MVHSAFSKKTSNLTPKKNIELKISNQNVNLRYPYTSVENHTFLRLVKQDDWPTQSVIKTIDAEWITLACRNLHKHLVLKVRFFYLPRL